MSLNIGLDYDNTVTEDPKAFKKIIDVFRSAGHKVFIVTMRYESECKEIKNNYGSLVDGIINTDRQAKKKVTDDLGIPINVWIDDTPGAITKSAKEIWGWQFREGLIGTTNHITKMMTVVETDPTKPPFCIIFPAKDLDLYKTILS